MNPRNCPTKKAKRIDPPKRSEPCDSFPQICKRYNAFMRKNERPKHKFGLTGVKKWIDL